MGMDCAFNFRDFPNTDNMDGVFLEELSGDHFRLTVCSNSFFLPVVFNETTLLALDYCGWKSSQRRWGELDGVIRQLIDHYSFIFLLPMKLLRTGGLVGTGLYVTHRWNVMVLVPLVQILQTGVQRSAHGGYYIFTRTITSQEVIVTVSAVRLWSSQDMKSNAQIRNVHQIRPLFCVKTFVLL